MGSAGASRVGLITCRVLPEPDPDQQSLLDALRGAGVDAGLVAWDDPASDPARYDLCVVRSCWNYYEDPGGFIDWIQRAEAMTRVLNPLSVLRWNLHKSYLRAIESRGVPIVPTLWLERGEPSDLAATMRDRGWLDVVIKPSVSAASFRTRRFTIDEAARAQAFADRLVAERDAMVQPFMAGVEEPGERAVVFIDGELSHAVRKSPRLAGQDESVGPAIAVTAAERAVAERALAAVDPPQPRRLLYARADLVHDARRGPVVSELELIEPSLFLIQHPPALERLVRAIVRECGAAA